MAAFGEQNYGTPLGAVAPNGFFDAQGGGFYSYSGFSSRSGASGFSGSPGYSGFSAMCGPNGIEFLPYRPTLTFPLNFTLLSGIVQVTWKEAIPRDPCGDNVAYELQFTRTLSLDSGWKTLAADLEAGTTSFDFDVSGIPFTEDGGLRIRAKDSRNLWSSWSRSNEPFTISNHAPNQASIVAPISNDTFDYCIPVVWNENEVRDVDGHGITYLVEITDHFSSDEGWLPVPGGDALPSGTTNFNIASFDFPPGNDYGVRVSGVDSMGLSSVPAAVGPLSILHQGAFIIDTIPPEGSISINDGAALAADTKVKLSLFATDATTGVKDVRFRNAEEECWSDFDSFANEKFWDLPKSDGIKRIFVQYRDWADNVSEACDCEIVSRVLCDEGNVTDIEVFNGKLYAAFDANGNLVEYKVLIKQAAELPESELTALAKFQNYLYVASYGSSGAKIYRYDGVANLSFSIAGVKVLTMQAYDDILYLGLDDGRIMAFDGSSSTVSYSGMSAITRLRTDGSILFAAVRSGGEYLSTADGIVWNVNVL